MLYRRFFSTLLYRVCHEEGSGIPEWLEIKLYTSVLVYADEVNILVGRAHIVKKNTETIVVASKETGLKVNADKTKNASMSRNQNAVRSRNDDSSFEMVEGSNIWEQP